MNSSEAYLAYGVLILGLVNLLRLVIFMIGADVYDVLRQRKAKRTDPQEFPYITVIIPAHNEEVCIVRTVSSVLQNDYARKRIIVVDDGSTDRTYRRLNHFKKKNNVTKLVIVRQKNGGKATAINNALKNHTKGSSLVMVLDADSILDPFAISNMVKHFQDKSVVAAAANVKVIDGYGLITLAQRLEYVVSHRMKRALTVLNMEYIIGGVGSTFRKSMVQLCDYYDTDTITEDIDFTLKVIAQEGNKRNKIIFTSDVIAYTEGVTKLNSLIRQRFRWKYGRMQSFVKNRSLFFSKDKKHTRQLAWLYLPFVVLSEFFLLLEPIFMGFVLYVALMYGGLAGVLTVYLTVTFFNLINVISDDSENSKSKVRLLMLVPFAYPLLLIMSYVDFIALVRSLARLPDLITRRNQGSHWQHVERVGKSVPL
jgi:cellulose synthase/poly-beta-1,6-N-acetylglucosamine synthase-like glycosyltransferase